MQKSYRKWSNFESYLHFISFPMTLLHDYNCFLNSSLINLPSNLEANFLPYQGQVRVGQYIYTYIQY